MLVNKTDLSSLQSWHSCSLCSFSFFYQTVSLKKYTIAKNAAFEGSLPWVELRSSNLMAARPWARDRDLVCSPAKWGHTSI